MAEILYPPTDPVIAAIGMAEFFTVSDHHGVADSDNTVLASLDRLVDEWELEGSYFVETNRALSIPASFEANEPVGIIDFNEEKLVFEGPFACYSLVVIGGLQENHRIKSLCATFKSAMLLPFIEPIPENHLLHIPVLAVDSIERTE